MFTPTQSFAVPGVGANAASEHDSVLAEAHGRLAPAAPRRLLVQRGRVELQGITREFEVTFDPELHTVEIVAECAPWEVRLLSPCARMAEALAWSTLVTFFTACNRRLKDRPGKQREIVKVEGLVRDIEVTFDLVRRRIAVVGRLTPWAANMVIWDARLVEALAKDTLQAFFTEVRQAIARSPGKGRAPAGSGS